jgi:oligopeptide/dipeptide ABC transporter ATP-binding protein
MDVSPPRSPSAPVLAVSDLRVEYTTRHGRVQAVNGVELALSRGERLGLVGESGSGKSTTGWALLRLVPWPGRIVGGRVLYGGEDLLAKSERDMRRIRGAEIAMVIQGVRTGLNPLVPVGHQVKNVYRAHADVSERDAWARALEVLASVALPDPERVARSYPHELSGGMVQRVIIATALVCGPKVLIADEPTTGLDVTVQAQILDLLRDIAERQSTSTMIVTHDLGVVAQYCDRVAVLYAGRVIEQGPVIEFLRRPVHPYSIALREASSYDRVSRRARPAAGSRAAAVTGEGCAYRLRCPVALPECGRTLPPLAEVAPGRLVRCFRGAELVEGEAMRATVLAPTGA